MTAQISDTFMYQDRQYDLAGISEGGLFTPETIGISPVGYSTNCYRGYQAVFAVHEGRLVLKTLNASLYTDGPDRPEPLVGPPIQGVRPKRDDEDNSFNNIYENINYPLAYTGGVLIARSFVSRLYEHMGFHPPWKYEVVWELLFENGRLINAVDRSERMAEVRKRIEELDDVSRRLKPASDRRMNPGHLHGAFRPTGLPAAQPRKEACYGECTEDDDDRGDSITTIGRIVLSRDCTAAWDRPRDGLAAAQGHRRADFKTSQCADFPGRD